MLLMALAVTSNKSSIVTSNCPRQSNFRKNVRILVIHDADPSTGGKSFSVLSKVAM